MNTKTGYCQTIAELDSLYRLLNRLRETNQQLESKTGLTKLDLSDIGNSKRATTD